jgi:subtilisin-like proprotein convertase family protein
MKIKLLLSMSVMALCSGTALATLVTATGSSTDNTLIPDNYLNGVASTITLAGSGIQSVTAVQVTLNISDGFNGDYYVYLLHGSSSSVLLNRVGLVNSTINPYGYSDAGFNVTFADPAPNGDIHNYQNVSNPNGGAITGTWQPDGRNVSPFAVTGSTPRTALLNILNGSAGDGGWTLFVADTSEGGIGTLDGWSLQVTGNSETSTAVPEPSTVVAGALLLLPFGLSAVRHLRNRKLAE